jgi:8-oxo-dGTP diphosphatase
VSASGQASPRRRVLVVAAILAREGRVLLTRRAEGKHLAGLWEFPGGKVEEWESPETALAREIREELDLEVAALSPFVFVHHDYPETRILMLVYRGRPVGEPGAATLPWRWVPVSELDPASMPEADLPVVRALRSEAAA